MTMYEYPSIIDKNMYENSYIWIQVLRTEFRWWKCLKRYMQLIIFLGHLSMIFHAKLQNSDSGQSRLAMWGI